jgi:hypothetical protein
VKGASTAVLSLARLLEQRPRAAPACLLEPGLLPPQGMLFVGGEPKVGKSLLVANLALSLAAGGDRVGFPIPAPRRVLVGPFELPVAQFVSRLAVMRRAVGAAKERLLVDTRTSGRLLSAAQGLGHFVEAAKAAAAEVIVLDPLYSAHDQDENDTRAMAALCQALLRLRDASHAALAVVHHVRKSIGRHEIGSAFRGSSALQAAGDSYVLPTRPSPQLATVELRFQFRDAAAQPPRLLELHLQTLWFSSAASAAAAPAATRRKVAREDITQAFAQAGNPARYTNLRGHIMQLTECSKRTAQVAITEACQQGWIIPSDGQYRLPLSAGLAAGDCPRGVAPAPMPRAEATELAPKKSAQPSPPAFTPGAGGLRLFRQRETKSLHFFGEAPERRPWAIKRDDAPGRSCRALPKCIKRDTPCAYTRDYPIPRSLQWFQPQQSINLTNRPENSVRTSKGNNVARYTASNGQGDFVVCEHSGCSLLACRIGSGEVF